MYPFFRLVGTLLRAKPKPKLAPNELGEIHFRVRPWDLDMFLEVNNGRMLTLFDLGRFDLAVCNGLMSVLRKRRWGLVVAGSTVIYRKRLRLFNKVSMKTRFAGVDERWVYLEQTMLVGGVPASSVFLRTGVTKAGKVLPTAEVIQALGFDDQALPELNEWQQAWVESEKLRPWPPTTR